MDESKLKKSCARGSFYVSLGDQETASTELKNAQQSPRQDLSTEHTTRVYFAVHCDQHWAAVELSISSFVLRVFPGQTFFRSWFRYTWCCETAQSADRSREVFRTVQRIYDYYYRPSPWKFSNQYCYKNPPESSLNETTCAKKVESTLLGYIKGAEFFLPDFDVDEVPPKQITIREINHNHNRKRKRYEIDELDGTDDGEEGEGGDGTDDGEEGEGGDRTDNDEGNNTGGGGNTNATAKSIEAVSKKIKKALNEMFPGKNNKGSAKQVQVQARRINMDGYSGQLPSTDVIPSDFEARFARGEFATKNRSSCLENLLWQPSSLHQGAREIAWKSSFTAACIRKIRHGTLSLSEETGASQSTVTRWTIAAWMINLIVDGLWPTWGPNAALVYEALAAKNYSLSHVVQFSEKTRHEIVQGVVDNLKKSKPVVSGDIYVFHPAACLSSALDISYKEICRDLSLERSFSNLDPPQSLQSHAPLSLLSSQWDQYLTLQAGGSTSSKFDTLTAVVQLIIDTQNEQTNVAGSSSAGGPALYGNTPTNSTLHGHQGVTRESITNLVPEQIAAATQCQQSHSARSSSTSDRIAMSLPELQVPEETHQEVVAKTTNLGGAEAQMRDMTIAVMAEVEKLKKTLEVHLFEGIDQSKMREQEMKRKCLRFTDTVRLHIADRPGEDIKLEMWLCASIGKKISQTTIHSAEDLRNILGGYLFEAMKASNWWKEEEKKVMRDFSDAVNVSDVHDDSDCEVGVLLGFETGMDFYRKVFPALESDTFSDGNGFL